MTSVTSRLAGFVALIISSCNVIAAPPSEPSGTESPAPTLSDSSKPRALETEASVTPANDAANLTRRLDERRRDDPYTLSVGGRPLAITGEFQSSIFRRKDFALAEGAKDDLTRLDQEFQLEALYKLGGNSRIFLEMKGLTEIETQKEAGGESSDATVERGQMWIYLDGPLGSAIQVGRMNFRERRSWWWDDDLDAVRLQIVGSSLTAQVAWARELAPTVVSREIDPAQEDVRRVLAHVGWRYLRRHNLELFYLNQRDDSETGVTGFLLPRDRRDGSDAQLRWIGLRASGNVRFGSEGRFIYWFDTASVRGDERLVEYSSVNSTTSQIQGMRERRVSGHAIDFGAGLQLDWTLRPSLNFGFARASGDADSSDGVDRAFRQTGLEENKSRLLGVKRFRYYGELTQPTLANLEVLTGGLGFRPTKESSVDLLMHRYRQSVAASTISGFRIGAPLDGTNRELGHEIDVVIAVRESKSWEFVITGATFTAGRAYGAQAGRKAKYGELSVTYNF